MEVVHELGAVPLYIQDILEAEPDIHEGAVLLKLPAGYTGSHI